MEKMNIRIRVLSRINTGNYQHEEVELSVEFAVESDLNTYPAIMETELAKLKSIAAGKKAAPKSEPKQTPAARDGAKEGRQGSGSKETGGRELDSAEKELAQRVFLNQKALALGIKNPGKASTAALIKRIDKVETKNAELAAANDLGNNDDDDIKEEDLGLDEPKPPTVDEVRKIMGEYVQNGQMSGADATALVKKFGEADKLEFVKGTKYQAILDGAKALIKEKEKELELDI